MVLDQARLGHRGGHVDHRRHDRLAHVARDRRRVLDAVLQAEDQRAVVEMRRHLARHRVGVGRLDAEQHQVGAAHRCEVDARRDADRLDAAGHVEAQAVAFDGLHVRSAPDQRDAMAGAREHGAEEAADGAGADDGNRVEPMSHRSLGFESTTAPEW